MNNEADACTIFKNSIIEAKGLCWKIPDPANMFAQTSQRPFDHFGVFQGRPLYAEAKYLSALKSFDLQRIEDHQIENLCAIKEQVFNAHCWIVLAVKVGRGDNRFYIFDDPFLIETRRKNKENFLKKELEALPYFSVKKSLIDLTNYKGVHKNGTI
jgi:penicillin-binding protein-related factor A (putative recombinase)